MILGIDEVGRGPWAGPLVIGAVVLGDVVIEGLTDSKKLTAKKRELLESEIYDKAAAVGLGWVDASEIDEVGLSEALKLATRRAVEQIKVPYHQIIIDGTVNFLAGTSKGAYVTTMKKADLLISSVSAASIVAKVARDRYMAEQAEKYPDYGFDAHVGYGTAQHKKALDAYGVTPLHRRSFAPVRENMKNTTSIGDAAESIASQYLEELGHVIRERNWKTKMCEIDIVSEKDQVIYCHEVKYRAKNIWGDGIDAITSKKLASMTKAARMYVQYYKLHARDIRLTAISMSGEPPVVDKYLELG